MLRTGQGDVVLDIPPEEVQRLQIREQQQIRVEGVYVGAPTGVQTRERIVARLIVSNGQEQTVENPVRLTAQDRAQIRAYEEEQQKLQVQTQTEQATQTRESQGSGGSGSAGGGTGK